MEDQERSHLEARTQLAGIYRELAQSAGFRDLRKELETRVADLKSRWMVADDQEAQKIRLRAQVYSEIFDLVKSKIIQGDMAIRTLRGEEAEEAK